MREISLFWLEKARLIDNEEKNKCRAWDKFLEWGIAKEKELQQAWKHKQKVDAKHLKAEERRIKRMGSFK